jgi:RHS repeat-associated protein
VVTGAVTSGEVGLCLDDKSDSGAAGNKVEVWQCNGGASQSWVVWDDGSVQVAGGCLATSGGGTSNGTLVVLEPCTSGAAAQQWEPGSGQTLVSPASGKCLEDPGASTTNGTQLDINACSTAADEQWGMPSSASGFVTDGVTGGCADDKADSSVAGAVVEIWQCNAGASQTWTAEASGTIQINSLCAEPSGAGTTQNTVIVLESCSGITAQDWAVGPDGWVWNVNAAMCLSDPNASTTNGTQLVIAACNGSTQQDWQAPPSLDPAGQVASGVTGECADYASPAAVISGCSSTNADFKFRNDGTIRTAGLCLGPSGGATAVNTPMVVETCTGATGDVWAVGPDGWVWDIAAGLCLSDPNASTVSGTQLIIATCNGKPQQTWTAPPTTVPAAPEAVAATAGNAQATVSWLAPWSDGGTPVTSYTVTASPGGATASVSGAATSATVTGLTNGNSYTFTVTATTAVATSGASAASASIMLAPVPDPPTGVTAAAGNGRAIISWTAPDTDNGEALTGYTVTTSPGGATTSTSGSVIAATVTGLTNGTAYTFTVTAANAAGTSAASAPSSPVTPGSGTTLYAHDPDGRVTAVFDGSGAGSKISYDADGNITSVTPLPAGTLAVAQVSPPAAAAGATVRIYGTGFGSSAAAAQVTIGGAAAAIQSLNQNEIVATVPSGASGSGVSVTVGGVSASGALNVSASPPVPAVTGLSEQVGSPGGTLTVTGTGFSATAAMDVASINGTKVSVTSATTTSLQVTLPPLAVAGQLTVTTPGGTATSSAQVVTAPPPYLAANVGFAGGLASGTQTTITLSSANQIGLALFTVKAGQRASVAVNASIPDASGETNEYMINIYGPDGQEVAGSNGDEDTTNPDTFSLPDDSPPGTYEIELIPVNGDTGSFQVTATTITDPTAALTIGGAAVPVSVTSAGQRPQWRFTGTAGQQVYLQWSPEACPQCSVRLSSPDGSTVASDHLSDAFLTATLPVSGTYTFSMDIEPATGTYTAQVSAIPAAATGTTTVDGTAGSVTISKPGQDGTVSFAGTAGQQVFTQVSFSPGAFGDITVLGPDGSLEGQAQSTGEATTAVDTVTLPATGTYQVRLTNLQTPTLTETGYTGTITVAVTSAPDVTASTTVDGTAASLSIAKPGQHGVVSFSGTAGEKVFTKLTMSPSDSNDGDGTVQLVQEPGGTVLGQNPLGGSSGYLDTVTLPASGTYEVIADPTGITGGYTGTMTVAVTSAPDQDGSTSVDGTAGSVSLAKPGEQGVVSFPGTAGQNVFTQISLSPAAASPDCGTVKLVDVTTGALVGDSNNCLFLPPVFIDDATLPDTGTYQVIVTPSGGYTGTVTVSVTSVPAPASASGAYGGPATTVTTTRPGQDASITYTGVPAGAQAELNVTASGFSSSSPPTGDLTGPDGSVYFCGDLTVGTPCTQSLSAAGTYTLTISHDGPQTGSISIQLTAAPARAAVHPRLVPEPRNLTPAGQPFQGSGRQPLIAAPSAVPASRIRTVLPRRPDQRRPAARRGAPRWSYDAAVHLRAPASLTGTIRTTAGAPLPGVTVSIGSRHARTDTAGRFRLTGLPQGMQVMEMDGTTASTARQSFGVFEVQVRLRAGANRLPFTSYFPVLDTTHEVTISEPLARSVTLTTPAIPGLEVHVPAGARITNAAGQPVYKVGITAIPVHRTPIPMPVGEQVPVFFTVQPAGGHITGGWATIDYPNYHHAPPGTPVDFWHYSPHGQGWDIYGSGTVDQAGTQITPGPGTWVTDFNGAMISTSGYPNPAESWLAKFLNFAGDPVDPATGLYHMTQTDLTVRDVIPLTLTRGYNPADGNVRQFGNNSSDLYDTFLTHDEQEPELYTEADLNLIDGARIHFARITAGTSYTDAVMRAQSTSPQFHGATLAWNGAGWNLTLRDGLTLVYGENAPLQEIRDSHGNTVRIYRLYQNSYGNYTGPITHVVSPNGYWMAYTWNTSDDPPLITKVTDNAGQSVSYTYGPAGNLSTVTDPDGQVTKYGYDSSNRLTTITDPTGVKYLTNVYNSSGQVTSQTIAGQGTYQFSYTPQSASAAASHGISSRFAPAAPAPARTSAASPQMAATQVTEPDGTVRNLTFDAQGYLTSDQRAAGTSPAHTIAISRDSAAATADLPGSVSDGRGRSISSTYDSNGNELTNTYTSGASSISSSATYNGTSYGEPDSVTNPGGQTEHFTYDGGGDMTGVTDPLGHTGTATYNSQGSQTSVTSPLGAKTSSTYVGGQLTSSTDPRGEVSRYAYDQDGRLVEVVNPDGTSTSTTYGAANEVAATTDADGNTTSYAYDANGDLHQVTDPKGNLTTYGYNSADELISVTDALGNTTSYTYNAAGEMTSTTDPDGKTTVYQYDSVGRLTFTGYGQNASGGYQSTLTYSYDPGTGNLDSVTDSTADAGSITYKYDAFDHVTSETGPGGTIGYGYNAAGQLTSMTPPGQQQIDYTYDADGRLKTETQGSQSASYTYNADGQLTTETMPDGISADYTYDSGGDLTEIDYWEGGSDFVGNVTYGYDADGQRIAEGGTLVHTVLPARQTGNSYNADNELTSFGGSTYRYDADGNLLSDGTSTYSWNDRGQLTSVTGPSGASTLSYDPLGRLISTSVAGVTTSFAYQGSQLVSETGSNGISASFLNGPYGTLSRTDTSTTGNGAVQAYLPDALDSTLALVNSAGQVQTSYSYDLFGNTTSSAGAGDPNPLRYTGLISGPVMPAGLQDNNARDYSPATGQFISVDPTGAAGSGDNLYQYAGGDPVDNSDPSGLQWQILAAVCVVGGITNDIGGAMDGRKHSLGDFFMGGVDGCVGGALMSLDSATEALDGLEGGELALSGQDGGEDLGGLGDGLGGDGSGSDGGGEDSCSTSPSSCGEWATISGILRDAAAGKGNFGLGEATEQVAEQAGKAWVGPGYKVASDGKTLVSSDGLRVYRPPSFKPRLGKWQANFEWKLRAGGPPFGNGHLDILGKM